MHRLFFTFWGMLIVYLCPAQTTTTNRPPAVIAYYSGNATDIDRYAVNQLTHIIYSFGSLKGNKLYVSPQGGMILKKLVSLKKRHPSLKVSLAFGGWGGCKNCSSVFAAAGNRKVFAQSVLAILQQYQLDGFDLDWEFPTLETLPGHTYSPNDIYYFTELVQTIRATIGTRYELSFAAGVFPEYLYQSVEWKKVMPLVNRVHLMTFDMVNRKSANTGHHTALFSTSVQKTSIDNTIRFLDSLQIPRHQIVIGAAFFARLYELRDTLHHGLYRPCLFRRFAVYRSYQQGFSAANGYTCYWDDEAKAPYCVNTKQKLFATFDNIRSVQLKTRYAMEKRLYGIMFWELRQDKTQHGLLNAIYQVTRHRLPVTGNWQPATGTR